MPTDQIFIAGNSAAQTTNPTLATQLEILRELYRARNRREQVLMFIRTSPPDTHDALFAEFERLEMLGRKGAF